MIKSLITFLLLSLLFISCDKENEDERNEVQIPNFNFPQTIIFEEKLSDYKIYSGNPSELIPDSGFHLLELSSVLFTDYAIKQRLIKIPENTTITVENNGTLKFPNGTILSKTFYYLENVSDHYSDKNIIETRLLIKENDTWNIGTYIWNDDQTEATYSINGHEKKVSWLDESGAQKSTNYKVPSQNDCMTCHQNQNTIAPIGPSSINLNRDIINDGFEGNQFDYLKDLGLIAMQGKSFPEMVNYKNESESLSNRARAYLSINCGHCHNPNAWNKPAERDFDFRHETDFSNTGIERGKDKILEVIQSREMPFIGTTMLDEEGVGLLVEYLSQL